MHIVVFGGSGFLGKHVSRAILNAGHSLSVISRTVPASAPSNYFKGDIFDIDSYAHHLKSADAVVHSVGQFFPSPTYKKLVNEPLTPCTAVKLAKSRFEGGNPLTDGLFKINTTSAEILAQVTEKAAQETGKSKAFVYISAESSPLTSDDYIESKRRAEQLIADNKHLRSVFLRPGILYDPNYTPGFPPSMRDIVSASMAAWDTVGGNAPRTLVTTLANAVVDACVDNEISGVVPNSALRHYQDFTIN